MGSAGSSCFSDSTTATGSAELDGATGCVTTAFAFLFLEPGGLPRFFGAASFSSVFSLMLSSFVIFSSLFGSSSLGFPPLLQLLLLQAAQKVPENCPSVLSQFLLRSEWVE